MQLLGYKINSNYPNLPANGKTIINTINPHSYCVAKKDLSFKTALLESDVLLPDGIGIVWAAKILTGRSITKIAGFDIFLYVMGHLNSIGGSCFFLGAAEDTLALIKARSLKEYPNVSVNSFSPPYRSEFKKEDSAIMAIQVNKHCPDVLFVGMTAPKQEKWVHEFKGQLNVNIICSIGAVFDFYAGTVKRPSNFWINLGLEWLPRFIKEPRRLAHRNLVSTPKFVLEVLYRKIIGKSNF